MQIELLYFDGCPSWENGLQNRARPVVVGVPERRHDDDAAGNELAGHRFKARERHTLPFQLERGPAAEEVVVRLQEPPGIIRRGIGDAALTMVGVDRTKKDAEGLTEKYGITRVPTFVFLRDGKVIFDGSAEELTQVEDDYIREYIA